MPINTTLIDAMAAVVNPLDTVVSPTLPAPVINKLDTNPPVLSGTIHDISAGATALQDILNTLGATLQVGDTIRCPVGAIYNPVVLPARSDSGWIKIMPLGVDTNYPPMVRVGNSVTNTPPNPANMFTIPLPALTGDTGGADFLSQALSIPVETSGWWFQGMELRPRAGDTILHAWTHQPAGNRLIYDRCYIHGNLTGQMSNPIYFLFNTDVQVWNSWLEEAKNLSGESHAIFLRCCIRVHIENNELQGASENILIDDGQSQRASVDVSILRNHMFKPDRWRKFLDDQVTLNPNWDGVVGDGTSNPYAVKNLMEVKWGNRVLIKGNILENCWFPGQDGVAMVSNMQGNSATQNCQDLQWESNTIINTHAFIDMNTFQPQFPAQRLAFINNLGKNVRVRGVFLNHAAQDVNVSHNTIMPIDQITPPLGSRSGFAPSPDAQGSMPRLTVTGNVWGCGQYGMVLTVAPITTISPTKTQLDAVLIDRTFAGNALFGNANNDPTQSIGNGGQATDIGFALYVSAVTAGINADGTLTASSPLKANQIGYTGIDGKDIGVDFVKLAADQGPAPAVSVPTANFTYTPVDGTFTINFQDLSFDGGSAITGLAWSGPDGFSSNTNNPTPSFTFPTSGSKSITLVATNAIGSSPPATFQVNVAPLPGFAYVQTTASNVVPSLQVVVPSLTVGNLLVVHVVHANGGSAAAITGVIDTAGNIYTATTADVTFVNGHDRTFYTVVTSGSPSSVAITATMSGTGVSAALAAREYKPLLGAISFIGSTPLQTGGGPSPMDSGGLTTTATGLLLLGHNDYDAVQPQQPTGWTERGPSGIMGDKLNAVAGTFHYQPTFTGAQNWLAELLIFSSAAPPPDTTPPTVPTGLAVATPVPSTSVALTWTPSFDVSGVANYDVARDGVIVGMPVTTVSFTDTGLQQQTMYTYTVRARDASANANVSVFSTGFPVTTGTIPVGTPLPPRFMRGFGIVRGAGTTDTIQTPDLGSGTQRTLTFWLRLDSASTLQCVWTKASQTIQSLTERLLVQTDNALHFQRQWTAGLGDWSVPVPTFGVRHFIVIRYDSSSTSNVPLIKIDNVQQTVTVINTPTGTAATQNTPGYMLGNYPGSGGVLGGDLARFAVYNFLTTDDQDVALFGANDPLGIGAGPVQYVVLDGSSGEPDKVTGTLSTITGTRTQDYNPTSSVVTFSSGRTMLGWTR